ncbi:Cd(II)/Pb(II)-responsive transcriptional regulator [Ramlibacter tataouinensis]|uniref:Cd(II)/Pb(II)-responsive transcriptional regulator n=1 Tax=Ramlibacter tataouinensis TaxID=94132 RepID=UPI0002EA7636|nr:Cd(II)/Pb(II)-responsive transcriptional regulator [Ramlibacter tataouinensis]
MKISDLARATGVDVDTIRYYEKAGLLPEPAREANGYRHYGPAQLERLAFVRHCRALDMPLADIKRLLQALDGQGDDVDALVQAQLARVRARLQSLQALEHQLVALQALCDADHARHPCGILQELVAAAHGEACACHAPARASGLG